MANAFANLPGGQRILLRRIVAYQENGFCLRQLVHGQKRIAGAVAERRNESGVIRGTVMIDIVRSKRGPCQPLEQIVLFIRSAVRTDKANRIFAACIVNLFESRRGGLRSLFPRNGIKSVAFAYQRLANPLRVLGEIKAEAPLDAK